MNENILQAQINQILEIVKSHDNRFNSIEERIDVLSEQIRQLDKQHGERLAKLEVITLGHDNRMDKLTTQVDKMTDKVDSMLKWVIGLILGLLLPMWASIIIAILLK
jgi:DNA repair exonuclease SbcCD ATPase subunit